MPASWPQIKSKSEKLRHLISFKKSSFDVFFSAGTADLDLGSSTFYSTLGLFLYFDEMPSVM